MQSPWAHVTAKLRLVVTEWTIMVVMDLVIKHGTVATASGGAVLDVGVDGGQIVQLGGTMS
ncbi:MAG: hypothetical protein QGF99_02050, partial [Acidimicrobiales bacterium]|nr:hypothetical protein [Acidimicrobiales bacterium]